MTKTNKTRSALFTSIISLLLCVSMLVGTTFAWFTDTAASGLNEIIAGNLDVALLDNAGNSVEGDTELFTMPELWEPGAVAYTQIQVANKGTLDLKASLSINYEDVNSIDGHVLSEVLKYAIIDASNVDLSSREAVLKAAKESNNKGALSIYDFSIKLQAGEASALQTLVIFWEPNANDVDNLYNVNNGKTTSDGKPLQINLGVKVFATQLGGNNDNEHDSFGTDYDENAPTIITVGNDSTVYATIADAYAATNSTSFNVSGPIDMTKLGDLFTTANQNVTFNQIEGSAAAYYDFSQTAVNVNGASITINGGYIQGMRSNTGNGFGFQHTTGTITYNNVTINDSWTNEHGATVAYNKCVFTGTYYVWTYSVPSIAFNECIFDKEDSRAILVYSHGNVPVEATVKNCQFYADAKGYTGVPAWTAAVEVDTTNISSTGTTVAISGCSADQNYNGIVRDKSAVGKANATITVDGEPVINSQAAFVAAIAARKTNIYLTAGNYTMVNTNYDVTISGTSDAILTLPKGVTGNGNTITFDGITVVGITTFNSEGKADWYTTQLNGATKAVYQNCTIKGLITGYCDSNFINCVFENNFPDEYSVYCYSGSTYNFTDCTFNTACSKAIKVYDEGSSAANGRTVNVTNCKFVASASDKAAVEIDSTQNGKYVVNITNCEINEYYSKLWNDKGTNSVVTVDGVTAVATAEALSNLLTADEQNISVMLAGDIAVPMSSLGQQTGGSGEYKLGGDSTESIVIDLNGHKLTLTTGYMTAIGAKNADATITIKNGSMNGTGNSATTWNINDLILANCNYVIENVVFDKEVALTNTGKTTTMKNVTINGTGDYYALWISARGQNVEIDGLTINSNGRGIKIDEQYVAAPAKVTLKVSNADINTNNKAAILVKSVAGADIALANVDISGVAADTNSAVWVDEDSADYADLVTVVGGIKIVEP